MGLVLNQTLSNGLQVSYWKITSIAIDRLSQVVRINVVSYKDEASRKANLDPVTNHIILIKDPTQFMSLVTDTNIIETTYNIIKILPEFSGSIDSL